MIKPKFISKKCPHDRRKARCKECKGGSICEHNRNRYFCKDCGGKEICIYRRQRHQCKECQLRKYSLLLLGKEIEIRVSDSKVFVTRIMLQKKWCFL